MSRRRLIVNADDLGLHAGINAGVLKAHHEGIVTSASLSPNGRCFEDAIRLARAAPGLGLGVHLTLVGEAPLSDPALLPSLAPDGRLPGYFTALFRSLLLRRIRESEIELELQAQLARVADAGIAVSHLDSHQHVHLHPAILPIVVRLARRFAIRAVRAAGSVLPFSGLRPALLSLFAARAARRLRAEGVRTPDTCLGLAEPGALDEERLAALIARVGPGVGEIVCHPGVGDAEIGSVYAWGFSWDAETRALTSARAREALRQHEIQLVSYREL